MKQIVLSDPGWHPTFPHLVTPKPDEWLAGLLLRCDEVNQWVCGTTLGNLNALAGKPFTKKWQDLIAPQSVRLSDFAELLALPLSTVLATTYDLELQHFPGSIRPPSARLGFSLQFRVCPECVAQDRVLRRSHLLPYITICPVHHVVLLEKCSCETELYPFTTNTRPFTCLHCTLDWETLSRITAHPERLLFEQQLLAYYAFFFAKGTYALFQSTIQLVHEYMTEMAIDPSSLLDEETQHLPKGHVRSHRVAQFVTFLGPLVYALIQLRLSPRDILKYAAPLPWRSIKWLGFQCPVRSCPYMRMMKSDERTVEEYDNLLHAHVLPQGDKEENSL